MQTSATSSQPVAKVERNILSGPRAAPGSSPPLTTSFRTSSQHQAPQATSQHTTFSHGDFLPGPCFGLFATSSHDLSLKTSFKTSSHDLFQGSCLTASLDLLSRFVFRPPCRTSCDKVMGPMRSIQNCAEKTVPNWHKYKPNY